MDGKKKGKTELFVADEIEDDNNKYKKVLSENNIAIAAKLAGSGETGEQGYLLLGSKQSGNPYNKQDIQVLDIIANELVIAIQNALRFEEIETFNLTLQQKVNDATKQLRQTNEKLKALDETKDEFISMASHQLRTPLTAVKGYVSMVVEGDAGKLNKQQKELLDQAFASSQRMVYLIADLLNVSRLKSGKFVIENKPTQLAEVVESEMQQLTDMANSKQQTLTYEKPDKFPTLMLDETKIRQVIMNFADNALHYTQNGGHIQIYLEDKGDSIEFTVVDDGLGVPKAEQHHLFTKFYRAGNAKKARPDGTGLGLFMAKKVVVAQGGAIIFKSEEGKGSTFGFTFPKAKVLAPAPSKSRVNTEDTSKANPLAVPESEAKTAKK
jgi:signal transduction histidine kinase